jgi:alpha-beta hydrolase superfamily lysophospholipase
MGTKTTFTFTDPDDFAIFVYKWRPDPGVAPRGVVQIAHGAAEHALRYERFATFLNQHGYVAYANDHRGHWKTAGTPKKGGICGENGWNGMVLDLKQLSDIAREEHSDLPFFLFGHSMGSMLAQDYAQRWGDELDGLILSGTTGSLGDNLEELVAAAEQMVQEQGADVPSALFGQMFAGFNQPFEPGETGFEWLSRDQQEVQKYVEDPWCGFPFTNYMVLAFLRGGLKIWQPENEARIPNDLPMLVFSGALDPVGGNTLGVKALVERYRANGVEDINVKSYPGGRHEMLNETNRDEVHQHVVDWLDSQVGKFSGTQPRASKRWHGPGTPLQ